MKIKYAFICAVLFLSGIASAKQDIASNIFKPNDNVCLVGDSITAGGKYTEQLMLYYITRFPNQPMAFYNLGISGDSCGGILWRMEWDILSIKPSVTTLMIGMNDVNRKRFNEEGRKNPKIGEGVEATRVNYAKNLEQIIGTLSKKSRKLVVFTPSIYDQTAELKEENLIGVNDELTVYGEIGKSLAGKKSNTATVDMNSNMSHINELHQKLKGKDKTIVGNDRVHPREFGGFIMAHTFLKTFGEPQYVSEAVLNAASKSLEKSFNCNVSDIKFDPKKISFTIYQDALPMPIDEAATEALDYVDFQNDFNKEILSVVALPYGSYILKIDGNPVGIYRESDFWKGINLAENKETPQYKQAVEVAALCKKFCGNAAAYRGIFMLDLFNRKAFDQMKTVGEKIDFIKKKLADAMEKKERDFFIKAYNYYIENKSKEKEVFEKIYAEQKEIYKAARPKTHSYEIIRK